MALSDHDPCQSPLGQPGSVSLDHGRTDPAASGMPGHEVLLPQTKGPAKVDSASRRNALRVPHPYCSDRDISDDSRN